MRRALVVFATVALVGVVVIGLMQAGGGERDEAKPFDLAQAKQQLAGAPAPLAALHDQSSEILDGGVDAFQTRLSELEGTPLVINKWASWCRPCRAEFPIFQQVATERGKEIAFLGVNGGDKLPAAREVPRRAAAAVPVLRGPRRGDRPRAQGGEVLPDDDLRRRQREDGSPRPASTPRAPNSSSRHRPVPRHVNELRVDPLTGLTDDHRRRARRPPRRPLRPRSAGADRRREGPVRPRPRGPHAARGLRRAPERRRPGHARAGPSAWCRTSTPR